MKRFMGFINKEFLHIFRDYRTLFILFGIPAAQILIFGYAVSMDIKNAGTAILDLSHDELKGLVCYLGEPAYRANDILNWVYQRLSASFDEMTNLPLPLRETLAST